MRIEVVISEWEQLCCGKPFRVGDRTTWKVLAADPSDSPATALPLFHEEHHDQTPNDVPHWDITGTVVSISGASYPLILAPGNARVMISDRTRPRTHPLTMVDGPAHVDVHENTDDDPEVDVECSEYRVTFDIPEGTPLPVYRLGVERAAHNQEEQRRAQVDLDRMSDAVGLLLEALADDTKRRYAHVARITRSDSHTAVTLQPLRPGSTSARFIRVLPATGTSDTTPDTDTVVVMIGDGTWRFPASVETVEVVRDLIDAAAAGSVYEHVGPKTSGRQSLETEVITADDIRRTSIDTVESLKGGTGFAMIAGPQRKRLLRGEHQYTPWKD
jgi:hypothetical protein